MNDAEDLTFVESVLELVGLQVERVPEAKTKRCDLRARDADEQYLIEIKGIHDDEAISKSIREKAFYESCRSFDDSNIEEVIKNAVKQLHETQNLAAPELRVIFLLTKNRQDDDLVTQQTIGILYGKRSLIGQGTGGISRHYECLYFAESAFFRHRGELDGVVAINANRDAALYINDHGHNLVRIRESKLGRFFFDRNALYDASAWKALGFLVADCPFDRRAESLKVQRHVEQTYGLAQTIQMPFKRHSAVVVVPNSHAEKCPGKRSDGNDVQI